MAVVAWDDAKARATLIRECSGKHGSRARRPWPLPELLFDHCTKY